MSDEVLLERIRESGALVDVLAGFEFDVTRVDPVEEVRLASGVELETVAGDGAGGSFFLCGKGPGRPVLYATSEGQAGLIGSDLAAALEVLVGLPYWMDCLKFSGNGSLEEMRKAEAALMIGATDDFPDLEKDRVLLRAELGIEVKPVGELLERLHSAVAATEPDFVLLGPEDDAYDSLFNQWRVSENAWLQERLRDQPQGS